MNREQLEDVKSILIGLRRTGQTTIAIESVKLNPNAKLIVLNCQMKRAIVNTTSLQLDRIITVEELSKLRGVPDAALVWDNSAIFGLLHQETNNEDTDLLDDDEYPTEYALNKIRNWSHRDGWNELMQFVSLVWKYPAHFDVRTVHGTATRYELITGGWSGNDDIISAMQGNFLFWRLCWESSFRVGKYIFTVDKNSSRT